MVDAINFEEDNGREILEFSSKLIIDILWLQRLPGCITIVCLWLCVCITFGFSSYKKYHIFFKMMPNDIYIYIFCQFDISVELHSLILNKCHVIYCRSVFYVVPYFFCRSPGKILSVSIPTFEALTQFGVATITTKNTGELEASYSLTVSLSNFSILHFVIILKFFQGVCWGNIASW